MSAAETFHKLEEFKFELDASCTEAVQARGLAEFDDKVEAFVRKLRQIAERIDETNSDDL